MELRSSNKIDVNRWELEIAVPPEEFSKEVDKIYNRQRNKITVPGFRQGKAPRSFIEKYYGEQIFYEDAVNALYPYALDDAAKEAKIELVDDHIDFEIVKLSRDDGLIFKVKVTVMPEVTVENYKGIEVKKRKAEEITEKDINDELKMLQERNARLVTSEDGAAEMGDTVNIDFEGSIDSELFEGGSAEGITLELGKKQFIEGFEGQVVGHKVGDEFEIKVKFPEDYHAPNLANKDAIFKTKLNKIQKKELPKIDDEFVKDISEFDTLEDFKADLKNKLSESKKNKAEIEAENELIEKFIELVKADIPDALVKRETKELIRDFEDRQLRSQGISLKDYTKYTGISEEKLEENFRSRALGYVKLNLGLKKVGQLENIEVSEEDIEKGYKKAAEKYRMTAEQIKKIIPKETLTKDVTEEKALEIIKNSKVEK